MGLASIVPVFTGQLAKQLSTPIYVVALGLAPFWVSIGMIIFRLFDALTDPVMGWVSDNTRTRWGRRRPYILVGAVLSAVALPLMWFVGRDWPPSMQIAWLVGSGLLLYTCSTIYCVPYESMMLELTPDYNERSRVMAFRSFLSNFGGLLIGWSWFLTQLPVFADADGKPDTVLGARAISIAAGVVIIIVGVMAALVVRERFYQVAGRQAKVSLRANLKATFQNRSFRILAAIAVTYVTGSFLIGELGFYLRLYYVCGGDQKLAAGLMGAQATMWLIISLCSVPVFQYLSTHWGKSRALTVSLTLCLVCGVTRWWLVTPEAPWLYLVNMGILAAGMTGTFQIMPSMNADIVDSDELESSVRREGAFASVFAWFVKLSFTFGMALPGFIVSAVGFDVKKAAEQAPGIMETMRLLDGLLPAALLVIPLLLLRWYRLTPERVAEIRALLERRRGKI